MSVTNKTIRELETAAVEAVQAMNELAELLFNGGSRVLLLDRRARAQVDRLRLAAVELDRAETACSRERCLTMSEAEMREEFAALGLDWDETTERGQALLQRLLAEYDAKREAEITSSRPLAGLDEVFEAAHDKVMAVYGDVQRSRPSVPPRKPVELAMQDDPRLLELEAAAIVARAVVPAWRHQLLDLLRSAQAVTSGMQDAAGFAGHYAWVEIRDAARTIRAGLVLSPDGARILYVLALCEVILREAQS